MKISRLYLKIFLAFLAVIIAAEIVVFFFIFTEKIPQHRARGAVDKSLMACRLIEREMQKTPLTPQTARERLTPLITVLARGFKGDIWITDCNGELVSKTFADTPPKNLTSKSTQKPTYHEPDHDVRLFVTKNADTRSVYMESEIFLHGAPLRVHLLMIKHARNEEIWFIQGMLFLTVLSALFLLPVSRTITRPVLQLSEAAERLGKGDFSQRATVKGHDEVAVLATKFNTMADSLEKMILSGKELTANLSHELRSPLARMRIALQMIMERGTAANDKLLNKIQNEIEHMDELIGNILELSKLDLREPPPRTDSLDVAASLRSLLDSFGPMIEQKELSLDNNLLETPPLLCHANSINILLENVLDNAVKYAAKGGAISLRTYSENNTLFIDIRNTHAPLSEKELADMFIPFHRLDKGKAAGAGLGLSTARKITAMHNGVMESYFEAEKICVLISFPLS